MNKATAHYQNFQATFGWLQRKKAPDKEASELESALALALRFSLARAPRARGKPVYS